MKQKYVIFKDAEKQAVIIQEFAELDKENMSLLCEEIFPFQKLEGAVGDGVARVVSELRTPNFYPPGMYTRKIAETIGSLWNEENPQPVDLVFDDINYLDRGLEEEEEDIEDEDPDIDDLLEDNIDEEFDDKDNINNINSPLKIADDDSLDVEDEG